MKRKTIVFAILCVTFFIQHQIHANPPSDIEKEVIVPCHLNAFKTSDDVTSIFFRTDRTGNLDLSLKGLRTKENASLKISIGNTSHVVTISPNDTGVVKVGSYKIKDTGYIKVDITPAVQRVNRSTMVINNLILKGKAVEGNVVFVKGTEAWWYNRGPYLYLEYQAPDSVSWFYNEVTVPVGQDVIGSYFEANGCSEGYLGIQVNSEKERRVLFSIWSSSQTNDHSKVPDSLKVKLLKKGDGVVTNDFGNEGSGGQSYLVYNWKAGNTYRFLTNAKPNPIKNTTVFSAYFYAPEEGKWRLIAQWEKPKVTTYLKFLYSFLEDFNSNYGHISRKGHYGNQFARTASGKWVELTKAKVYKSYGGERLDQTYGVEDNKFFLKICGFFSDYKVAKGQELTRQPNGVAPDINFDQLP